MNKQGLECHTDIISFYLLHSNCESGCEWAYPMTPIVLSYSLTVQFTLSVVYDSEREGEKWEGREDRGSSGNANARCDKTRQNSFFFS